MVSLTPSVHSFLGLLINRNKAFFVGKLEWYRPLATHRDKWKDIVTRTVRMWTVLIRLRTGISGRLL
jgi:hypothetical protein